MRCERMRVMKLLEGVGAAMELEVGEEIAVITESTNNINIITTTTHVSRAITNPITYSTLKLPRTIPHNRMGILAIPKVTLVYNISSMAHLRCNN